MVRTQNFLSPASCVSGTRGSVAGVSGTNAKFSKSSRACWLYERKIFEVQPRVVAVCVLVLRVVVVRTQNFLSPAARRSGTLCSVTGPRGSGTNAKFYCPAARDSGTRGSGARGSVTNAKFSKSSRAC